MNKTVSIDTSTSVCGFITRVDACSGMILATLNDLDGRSIRCQFGEAAQLTAFARLDRSSPVCVHGLGRWRRGHDAMWTLECVHVAGWTVLDSAPPDDVFALLMSPDNGWAGLPNPQKKWRDLRGFD